MPGLPIPFGASAAGGFVSYDTTIDTDSPLSHWKLGEASGATAFDRKGVNNGTYTGTPGYGAASLLSTNNGADTAVTFSGDDKIDLPSLALGAGTDATIEAWFASTATGTDLWMYGEGSTASVTPLFGLILQAGKVRGYWRNSAGTSLDLQTPLTYNDGQRHHAVLVKSGATLAIYVDGQLVAGPTATPGGAISLNTATIGALRRSTTGQWFNGTLDEVAVYSTALTGTRIGAHYTAGTTSSATDIAGTDAAVLSESATVVIFTSLAASDDMVASESSASVAASAATNDANSLSDASSLAATAAATDAATQSEDLASVVSTDAKAASDTATQTEGTAVVVSQDAKAASDSATQNEDPTALAVDTAANDALTQTEATSSTSAALAATDTATQSEGTSGVVSTDAKAASDSGTFSDVSALASTFGLAASETHTQSDASAFSAAVSASDTDVLSDVSALLQTNAVSASDSWLLAEASGVLSTLALSAQDASAFSDSSATARTLALSASDTFGAADASLASATIAAIDSFASSEFSIGANTLLVNGSDSFIGSEASSVFTTLAVAAIDALTQSDASQSQVSVSAADATTVTDSLSTLTVRLAALEALGFVDATTLTVSAVLAASDALAATETSQRSVSGMAITASDSAALSDASNISASLSRSDAQDQNEGVAGLKAALSRIENEFVLTESFFLAGEGIGAPDMTGPLGVFIETPRSAIRIESFGGSARDTAFTARAPDVYSPAKAVVRNEAGEATADTPVGDVVVVDQSGKVR